MRRHLLFSAVMVLSLLNVVPALGSSASFAQNVAQLSVRLADGTPVRITVRKMTLSSHYPYKNAFMWGGDELNMPRTFVRAVQVRVGSQRSYVPLSAYSDLGDPREVQVQQTAGGFQLLIRGGDAAGSYQAVLVFAKGVISRRKVFHREFPEEVWEETVYSFNTGTDKN